MPVILLETFINAPAAACFDAARDIGLHASAPGPLRHRAVAGVTRGLIELNEEVSWAASFFGVPVKMTSRIVAFDAPRAFTDEMRRGPFSRWRHTHTFEPRAGGTLMRDRVEFASPLGPLGAAFDALYLKAFMERFLVAHNAYLKSSVESAPRGGDLRRPHARAACGTARVRAATLDEKR